MASVHDRLKQCLVDSWTTREQLCLASAVTRSGDQNWAAVSRTIRFLTTETDRPPDWYSTKNCALQYDKLLEQVETPKRKREKGESYLNETPGEIVAKMLSKTSVKSSQLTLKNFIETERLEELEGILEEERATYNQLKRELQLLESNQCNNRLDQFWDEIMSEQEKELEEERKNKEWLTQREERIKIFQAAVKQQQSLKGQSSSQKIDIEMPKNTSSENVLQMDSMEMETNSLTTSVELPKSPIITSPKSILPVSPFKSTISENVSSIKVTSEIIPTVEKENKLEDFINFKTEENITKSNESNEIKFLSRESSLDGINSQICSGSTSDEGGIDMESNMSQPITFLLKENVSFDLKDGEKKDRQQMGEVLPKKIEMKINVKREKKDFKIADYSRIPNREKMELEKTPPVDLLELGEEKSPSKYLIEVKDDKVSSMKKIEGPLVKKFEVSSVKKLEGTLVKKIDDKLSVVKKVEDTDTGKRLLRGQTLSPKDKIKDLTPNKQDFGKLKTESTDSKTPNKEFKTSIREENIEKSGSNQADKSFDSKESQDDSDDWVSTRRGRKRKHIITPPKEEDKIKRPCIDKSKIKKEDEQSEKESKIGFDRKDLNQLSSSSSTNQLLIEKLETIEEKKRLEQDEKKKVVKKEVKDEYEFDDDVSRESTDVKDFLTNSRVERRKLPIGEGIASPVISESTPSSPASTSYGDDPEMEKQHRAWKRAIMLIWNDIAAHKNASIFLRPITEEKVPGYHSIVYRPIDLLTIKRNVESGHTRTTNDFQHNVMLMFLNAKMYNTFDHNIYKMADAMMRDAVDTLEEFIQAQMHAKVDETPQKSLRRETRESSTKKSEERKREERDEKPSKRKK